MTEKNKEIIEKENPGIDDSKAGTVFVINKNIIKWEKQGDKPWKHTIVERGKISMLKLEWNDYKMIIINVYIPNLKSNKAKIIEKLRDHLEAQLEESNLLVTGDFNFITDEQNRFPSHTDDSNLTNS